MSRYNNQINRRYNQQYSVNKKPYFVVTCVALVIMIIFLICAIAVTRSEYKKSQTLLVDSSSEVVIDDSSAENNSSAAGNTSNSSQSSSSKNDSATSSKPQSIEVIDGYSVYNFVGQSSDWRLKLSNRLNVINNYTPSTKYIGSQYCQNNDNYQIDERVYDDLIAMIEAAKEDGVKLISVSAYRSYSKQQSLYNNKVNYYLKQGYSQKGAENKASTIVAIPGTSDHNLGLAVDFNYLEQRYENKPELVWLKEHAEEYGFVMRYAKDKENYTGVIYEPWHYRYVGKELALELKNSGLCLEEYFAALN